MSTSLTQFYGYISLADKTVVFYLEDDAVSADETAATRVQHCSIGHILLYSRVFAVRAGSIVVHPLLPFLKSKICCH